MKNQLGVLLLVAVCAAGFAEAAPGGDDAEVMAELGFSSKDEMDFIGAASEGDVEKARGLLDAGMDINGKYGVMQNTALTTASNQGRLEMVEFLVGSGADVNQPGLLGWPPLMHAANGGHIEVADYLITHGADVNTRDQSGFTVLQQSGQNKEIMELLRKAGAKE